MNSQTCVFFRIFYSYHESVQRSWPLQAHWNANTKDHEHLEYPKTTITQEDLRSPVSSSLNLERRPLQQKDLQPVANRSSSSTTVQLPPRCFLLSWHQRWEGMDINPTHLQQPSPSLALSTAKSVPSERKRTRVIRPVQHRGRAIRPDKAGSPTSISAEEGEEQQQQIIPTRKKKGLRLPASIAHLRTQTASADGPPATIARDLDEIRGSPTPLAPRRRQKPRLTANGARRNLFRRDTTATASAASPSTLTLPHTHLANRPEVPPPSRRRSGRRREREPEVSPAARKGLVASWSPRAIRSNFYGRGCWERKMM